MAKEKTTRQQKPRTAYELLERVCEVIRENPLRYDQRDWLTVGRKHIVKEYGKNNVPECGTVGCRAGWIVVLHDGPRCALRSENLSKRADEILGLDGYDTGPLFSGGACFANSQTHAHAREGIRGLRAFMQLHRAHLKARLLKDVPK